ncbi:MAG: lipoyl synthase [Methanomassiliicoccales archaeon]|nr:lipoyl synthase [Methanomassiliicoccales archaeon]NYT15268.1 lipoyl synthase [Methanomassiliicoccales archaeon]
MPRSLDKPPWLKVRAPTDPKFKEMMDLISTMGLRTVCTASRCPNISECWSSGNAALMILGNTCTRNCGFCAVQYGNPKGEIDSDEGEKIAEIVEKLGLSHIVITSVTRDDLSDGGAGQFASVVTSIKKRSKETTIELLVPDFNGEETSIQTVVESHPDVLGHNLETVKRLQAKVRDRRASYEQSLRVLRRIGEFDETIFVKSSLMLGLGESEEEVLEAMEDLLEAGVDFLTLGQYLQPKGVRLRVSEYIPPNRFQDYRKNALDIGFRFVAAGPFVRSSYKAMEALDSV